MKPQTTNTSRIYFIAMGAYWLVFGLITAFYPKLMDMFQTETGISAKTAFSDHVWRHDGFDIVALAVLLFVLSGEVVSRKVIIATAVAALMATIAVFSSLLTTPYWNMMFIVAGIGCFAFVVWGFALAARSK
jgi:hypothetical protein